MALQKGFRYRSHYDIKREILALLSNEPRRKTHVMYETKLSFPQLQIYEDNLVSNGLMKVNDEGLWEITTAGRRKLEVLQEACA